MKKQIKRILCLTFVILFITLTPVMSYINIETNVYANSIALTGLGIKVVSTILASMGILKFIYDNKGLDEFYQGFITWLEEVKNYADAVSYVAQFGVWAIVNNAKMKVTELAKLVKEYYLTLKWQVVSSNPDFDIIPGAKGYSQGEISDVSINLSRNELVIDEKSIGNGYSIATSYRVAGSNYYFYTNILHNGSKVTTHESVVKVILTTYDTDNVRFKILSQVTDTTLVTTYIIQNFRSNKQENDIVTTNVPTLLGLSELPDLPIEYRNDMPVVYSVPINLTFPWDFGMSTADVIGLTVEQVMQYINNISLETYFDRLLDLPKSVVDSMNPPQVLVEDGVVTDVKETTVSDSDVDVKEQTNILTSIRDRIDVIIGKMDDFFNPDNEPPDKEPDNEGIDWGNFKGLFDIFYIFYYLIILVIIILIKFFSVVVSILDIPANSALFNQYPTMLAGLNYIKNIKVGGFNITLQQIFEYMFTVFFFLYIVTQLQKLYHSFSGIERQQLRENEREARIEERHNEYLVNRGYENYKNATGHSGARNKNNFNSEYHDAVNNWRMNNSDFYSKSIQAEKELDAALKSGDENLINKTWDKWK